MNKQILKSTLIAAAGLLFANSAMAAQATNTFQVTATVTDSCSVSATDLNSGPMIRLLLQLLMALVQLQ
ncbi:MAG: hypothetical protein PHF42_11290 [Pseudomonas sp.]|nr:hypothetical protein [Pseudomonas sp.]